MYKLTFIFVILFLNQINYANDFKDNKYLKLGLVVGVVKYYDTDISNGKQDWNKKCIQFLEEIEKINSNEEFENYLINILNQCNYEPENFIKEDKLNYSNYNFDWIKKYFNDENLKQILQKLILNKKTGNFYAKVSSLNNSLSFENEKKINNFDYKILSHRLLFLYNFWNLINYWNLNKCNFENNWLQVFENEVKVFLQINNFEEFELAKMKLIAQINDTHSFYLSNYFVENNLKHKPPFAVKNINDTLVVNYIYNKDLANANGIEIGDKIIKINNKEIKNLISNDLKDKISVSNETSLRRWSHYLLFNKNDFININVVNKNGEKLDKKIKLYEQYQYNEPHGISFYINDKIRNINNETSYINLENITKRELKYFFKINKRVNNLIIDLRNYPKYINEQDICDYILPEKTNFVKVLMPINKKPALSSFYESNITTNFFKPFEVGFKNKDYYKGKIILLVDSFTQSNAEFIGMAIQSSQNCITIGEQTGGSVLNITNMELLDGSKISFTGLVAYYPSGLKVLGEGLKIDVKLNPTTKNINPDYYLKKAIEIIKNK